MSLRIVKDSGEAKPGPVSVVLRPENIRLVEKGDGVLAATVQHRFFVGDHMEYEVRLASGQSMAAFVPYFPGMEMFEPGAEVEIDFEENAAVVLFQ